MRHAPRWSPRARRWAAAISLSLALLASCGGSEPTVVESSPATPFDGPHVLDPVPPGVPYLYDRVAVDEQAVVGVPGDPADDADRGRVIVYARGGDGDWSRTAAIEPATEGTEDFGEHLALDGTTLGVTANRRDPATEEREAVVHLFERSPDRGWLPTRVLLEGEGVRPSSLTLALRDGLLAVGHRPSFPISSPAGGGFDAGSAVRLFERDEGGSGTWGEVAPLLAPERDDGRADHFGADIAISPHGELLAVADTAQTADTGFGTFVFLFERTGSDDGWTRIRTFRDGELPSPYSAMLDLDDDTLVVTPMAARETHRVDLAVFERDAGEPDAWGRAAVLTVEVATPPDRLLPRDVFLATSLADDTLAVGIGPSACIDLRTEPDPGPTPCAGGRVHLFGPGAEAPSWDLRSVVADPTGAERSSYGEYVALDPGGDTLLAGGTVVPTDGAPYVHVELYTRAP